MLETWAINGRVNAYFIDAVDDGALWTKADKGKAVGAQFAHMHSVRMMWIKASAPDLIESLERIEEGTPKEALKEGLDASGRQMAILLDRGFDAGRVKGFKPNAAAFLGYLLAHEAHHRGQAELILRQLSFPLPDKIAYGLWEWGTRWLSYS